MWHRCPTGPAWCRRLGLWDRFRSAQPARPAVGPACNTNPHNSAAGQTRFRAPGLHDRAGPTLPGCGTALPRHHPVLPSHFNISSVRRRYIFAKLYLPESH
uniref:Uncharacterized protein n=1 Tax=Oryza rufipogon TaxID=4529 RepID=A0A0E0Q5B7_ORYRU